MLKKTTIVKSPYSPGLQLKKINLPERIILYYQKKGRFIKDLPSYEQVEGRDPWIPDKCKNPNFLESYLEESCSVRNKGEGAEKSKFYAQEVLSRFTRHNKKYFSKLKREYMLSGLTKPIRISALVDKNIKTVAYIKKPSIERIFGIELYNLFSGQPEQDFIFSEYSFIESPVAGIHINRLNKRRIENLPNFKESLIRLATLDDFISINDLERKVEPNETLSNLLVDEQGRVSAFDFNTMFNPDAFPESQLIPAMLNYGFDLPQIIEKEIRLDESRKIISRICKNKEKFNDLVKLLDEIPYMKSLFEEKGFKSAKNFFKIKELKLRSQAR